jgi:4-hydroxybenzoate polyprenyltransferase
VAGEDATAAAGHGPRLGAYAALVRVPNLFTAPPDVLLGAALVAATGATVRPAPVAGLAAASVLVYAAGTTLNDYFDADADAAERPERPIPSGRVTRRAARTLGIGLLLAGVGVAAGAAGLPGGVAAGALALVVLLYDGALKNGPVGFLAMGTARGLNVVLGATAAAAVPAPGALPEWALAVPVVVAGYIAAVTRMADDETVGGNRGAVAFAAGAALLAAAAAVAVALLGEATLLGSGSAILLAVAFLAWDGRALRRAYADPVPSTVGPAVGACVLGLVLLDAAFAAIAGPAWAVAAAAFLLPAVALGRAFDVS